MELATILFIGLGILIAILAARYIWKNVRRGIVYAIITLVVIYTLRNIVPQHFWDNLIATIEHYLYNQ